MFSTPYSQEIDVFGDELWINMWISNKTVGSHLLF